MSERLEVSKMASALCDRVAALEAERERLLERVAELTEAMRPFAKAASVWDGVEDAYKVTHYGRGVITVGDLRHARAVLSGGPVSQEER